MIGGTKATEELIAGCDRGVLVTHFFYIRSLEPRTVLYTGLTRDGAFLIEGGKVTRPLKNLRRNESPLLMLNRLEDIGRPEAVAAGRRMPALRIRDFNFTSMSDACSAATLSRPGAIVRIGRQEAPCTRYSWLC